MTSISGIYKRVDRHADYVVHTQLVNDVYVTVVGTLDHSRSPFGLLPHIETIKATHDPHEAKAFHMLALDSVRELRDTADPSYIGDVE